MMNSLSKALLLAPLLTIPAVPLSPLERGAIAEDESLADLRGGDRLSLADPLAPGEAESLARAETACTELEGVRGGDISNSELTTILLVLAIVALIVIIV